VRRINYIKIAIDHTSRWHKDYGVDFSQCKKIARDTILAYIKAVSPEQHQRYRTNQVLREWDAYYPQKRKGVKEGDRYE